MSVGAAECGIIEVLWGRHWDSSFSRKIIRITCKVDANIARWRVLAMGVNFNYNDKVWGASYTLVWTSFVSQEYPRVARNGLKNIGPRTMKISESYARAHDPLPQHSVSATAVLARYTPHFGSKGQPTVILGCNTVKVGAGLKAGLKPRKNTAQP